MMPLVGRAFAGGAVALVAATALVAVALARRGDDAPSVPAVGNLELDVLVRRPDGTQTVVVPGVTLRSGDELQFRVSFDAPGQLAIVALDGRPTATLYLPASRVEAGRGRVLDGTIVLDDARGAERIVAVWCPDALGELVGNDAILAAAGAAPGDPRRPAALALPCEQASTWFER